LPFEPALFGISLNLHRKGRYICLFGPFIEMEKEEWNGKESVGYMAGNNNCVGIMRKNSKGGLFLKV
jgi:hypothetical protein